MTIQIDQGFHNRFSTGEWQRFGDGEESLELCIKQPTYELVSWAAELIDRSGGPGLPAPLSLAISSMLKELVLDWKGVLGAGGQPLKYEYGLLQQVLGDRPAIAAAVQRHLLEHVRQLNTATANVMETEARANAAEARLAGRSEGPAPNPSGSTSSAPTPSSPSS